jgi:hypothetical protein
MSSVVQQEQLRNGRVAYIVSCGDATHQQVAGVNFPDGSKDDKSSECH